jgi:hypothetical protein
MDRLCQKRENATAIVCRSQLDLKTLIGHSNLILLRKQNKPFKCRLHRKYRGRFPFSTRIEIMRRIALFEHLTKISPCVRVLGVSCKKMCLKNRARSYLNCALGHRYTLDSAREATVAITYDPLRVLKQYPPQTSTSPLYCCNHLRPIEGTETISRRIVISLVCCHSLNCALYRQQDLSRGAPDRGQALSELR